MSTNAAKPAVAVTGYFDHITRGKAQGWAYAPQAPETRRSVEIVRDSMVVARGLADLPREDLARAGIGDGKHHFSLPLSYELQDGEEHVLTARDAETGITLAGGSHTFHSAPRNVGFDLMTRREAIQQLTRELSQPHRAALRPMASRLVQAYEYASLLQETGELGAARTAYPLLGKHLAQSALLAYKLGEVNLLAGEANSALSDFEAAIELEPTMAWAHVGRGHALMQLQRPFDAEESWDQALALAPDFPGLRARLDAIEALGLEGRIDALVQQGQHAEARELLTQRLLANPEDAQNHALLGRLLSSYTPPAELPGMQALTTHAEALSVLQHLLDTKANMRSTA